MEQLVYTSVAGSEQVGFQTVAKSRGLEAPLIAELESRFGFHGSPPDAVPDVGVFSFVEVQPGQFAAWRLFVQGRDASGSRANIWVHCFVFSKRELDVMRGDPFTLEDAGLFLRRDGRIDAVMAQVQAPSARKSFEQLGALMSLKQLQRDMLVAAGLCCGHAYVCGGNLTEVHIRALRYCLPANKRHLLTFYGMVTGVPRMKAKLIVLAKESFTRDLDRQADAIANLASEEYIGRDPAPYAAAVSRLLDANDLGSLADMVELAEELGSDVFGDNASHLIKAFDRRQEYIGIWDVGGLRQLAISLGASGNAAGVASYYNSALLAIGRAAVAKAPAEKVTEVIEAIIEAKPSMADSCDADAMAIVEGVWDRLSTVPTCLPSLVKASCIWPSEFAPRLKEVTRKFVAFRSALNSHAWSVERAVAFWRNMAEVVAGSRYVPQELREWVYASSLENALGPNDLKVVESIWRRYGRTIRSSGPSALVGGKLLETCVRPEYLEIMDYLLFRTDYAKSQGDLSAWLAWSAGDAVVFRHMAGRIGQLIGSPSELLRMAGDAYQKRLVTARQGIELVRRSFPDPRDCWHMSLRFLGDVPMLERFRLFEEASKTRDDRELDMMAEALIPSNQGEATTLASLAEERIEHLHRAAKKALLTALREAAHRCPHSGAGIVLLREKQRKMRIKVVALAVPGLAVLATLGWLGWSLVANSFSLPMQVPQGVPTSKSMPSGAGNMEQQVATQPSVGLLSPPSPEKSGPRP